MTNDSPLNPLADAGNFKVTLKAQNLARFPGLREAIEGFDAGDRPAARAATEWLREQLKAVDAGAPLESVTTLYFRDGALIGYFSLASGDAELRVKQRNQLGLRRRTQPAALLTWIAKSAHHACDGSELVKLATHQALKATEYLAATLLALDPFDEPTAERWRDKYAFLDSATLVPGREPLHRLVVPLREPDG